MSSTKRHSSELLEDSDSDTTFATPSKKRTKNNSFMLDEDDELESNEHDDTVSQIPPPAFATLLKAFTSWLTENKTGSTASCRRLKVLADDFLASSENNVDSRLFVASFKKYLAMAHKNTGVVSSCRLVEEYMSRGDSVLLWPDCPKKPPRAAQLYATKNGLKIGFGNTKILNDKFREDHPGRMEVEAEIAVLEEQYLKDLNTFVKDHASEMNIAQRDYVDKMIKRMRVKIHGTTPRAPSSGGSSRRKPKEKEEVTAFTLYCRTMKDRYADKTEEDRERKLRKKFDKLEDDKKEIFEKLALA